MGGADAYDAWTRVAVCEEGGWQNTGLPAYPNSLGILGLSPTSLAPADQIALAESVVDSLIGRVSSPGQGSVVIYHGWVPDQNGCASWP